ncbi:hypothetical protein [Sphingomonas jaspsi]|uniref:hypothetical protein n=1 Tax=Sphingomonas jaspsi TaxID=392409 RepID=UPI000685A2B4|nr:hypothetical protein [Sphingomonas jaspsi]
MAKRERRDMSVEEFHAWSAANKRFDDTRDAANEVGGPQLSLVPLPTTMKADGKLDDFDDPLAFDPEPSRQRLGWSALRQRVFIGALAETGSVHHAAKEALMTARSA